MSFATANTQQTSPNANKAAACFRAATELVQGENGALKVGMDHAGWVPLLATHDSVRKGGKSELAEVKANATTWVEKMLQYSQDTRNPMAIADAIKSMVAKRDPRDGEGERSIAFIWFLRLYDEYPETILTLVRNGLFGSHGCWGDIQKIVELINTDFKVTPNEYVARWGALIDAMRDSILSQRVADLRELDRFLKQTAQPGHWAQKGIRGYENLTQCQECVIWVNGHIQEACRNHIVVAQDGTPRWRILQMHIEECSKSEYLAQMAKSKGGIKPLNISWAGKWIGSENSKASNLTIFTRSTDSKGHTTIRKESVFNYFLRSSLKSVTPQGVTVEYPSAKSIPYAARKQFRIRTAALRAVLDVPEVKMCADLFHILNYKRVPSVCLNRQMNAFLNELGKEPLTAEQEETGDRHPENWSRVKSRKNLLAFTTDPDQMKKLNAKGCFPHQIAFSAKNAKTSAKKQTAQAQWVSMIEHIKTRLADARLKLAEEASSAGLQDSVLQSMASGNFLPCVDVSGSMTWDGKEPNRPIDIATAMGSCLSQVSNEVWNGLLISFTDEPRIFNTRGKKIDEVVKDIYSHMGYNTNFYKMQMTVLNHMVQNQVPEKDFPTLVVFTDGEWDTQDQHNKSSHWKTMHKRIVEEYARKGYRSVPTIVYWNLKPGRNGCQTKDNHPGVLFLQGQSPNLFNMILYAESLPSTEQEVVVDGKVVKVKTSEATPYDTFRKMMNSDFLSDVEQVLLDSREKLLIGYTEEFVQANC